MARSFLAGSSSYQSIALTLSSYQKLSMSVWLFWDGFANDDQLMMEYSPNFTTQPGWLIDPNSSSTKFDLFVSQGGGYNGGTFTRPSDGVWHHYLFWIDMSLGTALEVGCYIDGNSQSITQTQSNDCSAYNFTDTTLYLMSRAGTNYFGSGDIAEFALWPGIVLSEADANTLASGISPLSVKPQNQYFYFDEVRGLNDKLSTLTLTDSNTIIVAHPPIYYPYIPFYSMPSGAEPPADLSIDIGLDEAAYQGRGVRII